MTIQSIFNAALSLPRENRTALVEKLVASLEEDESDELSPAWRAEIERRIEAHKRGEMKAIPAEEVFRSLPTRVKT